MNKLLMNLITTPDALAKNIQRIIIDVFSNRDICINILPCPKEMEDELARKMVDGMCEGGETSYFIFKDRYPLSITKEPRYYCGFRIERPRVYTRVQIPEQLGDFLIHFPTKRKEYEEYVKNAMKINPVDDRDLLKRIVDHRRKLIGEICKRFSMVYKFNKEEHRLMHYYILEKELTIFDLNYKKRVIYPNKKELFKRVEDFLQGLNFLKAYDPAI